MSEIVTLTPRQRRAIESLLICGNVAAAARAANVSRKTLYQWLRQPVFKAELDSATATAIDSLSRALVSLGDDATATLSGAMSDTEAGWGVRVRAADVVLSRLLQLRELASLEQRVAALEQSNRS